jgi:hypothetical protein
MNKDFMLLMAVLTVFVTIIVIILSGIHTDDISTFSNSLNENEVFDENVEIKNLLDSLMNQEQKIIYEKDDRRIYENIHYATPLPLPTVPLSSVIQKGKETEFRTLSDDPLYLRPVYDPVWKQAYYRGWLDLPYKNMEARHKMFAFSLGLSMNYDIFGSLGYNPDVGVDAHRNINFLIYGFSVERVKVFENQVALVGKPQQTGARIISITQNHLLPEGVDTKDFLFQLSTPNGYEIDFLRYNIIRFEYLMQQIKENTVDAFTPLEESKSLEQLIKENKSLKEELSYFIPLKDQIIYQQSCDSGLYDQAETKDISTIIKQGQKIPFGYNYKNPDYKRPLYHPSWKANYKKMWFYIPRQIEFNLHRLLVIPKDKEFQKDFFGILGFGEKYQHLNPEQYGLMVYNFNVTDVILYKNRLLLVGTPSRTGAQIVSINVNNLKGYENYRVSLVTPDNSEVDCNILKP